MGYMELGHIVRGDKLRTSTHVQLYVNGEKQLKGFSNEANVKILEYNQTTAKLYEKAGLDKDKKYTQISDSYLVNGSETGENI